MVRTILVCALYYYYQFLSCRFICHYVGLTNKQL